MTNNNVGTPQMEPEQIYRIMLQARAARSEHLRQGIMFLSKRVKSGAASLSAMLAAFFAWIGTSDAAAPAPNFLSQQRVHWRWQ